VCVYIYAIVTRIFGGSFAGCFLIPLLVLYAVYYDTTTTTTVIYTHATIAFAPNVRYVRDLHFYRLRSRFSGVDIIIRARTVVACTIIIPYVTRTCDGRGQLLTNYTATVPRRAIIVITVICIYARAPASYI